MGPKFEIFQDGDGKFSFQLRSGEATTLLIGEPYAGKLNAQNAVSRVRSAIDKPERLVPQEHSGHHCFALHGDKGEILARTPKTTAAGDHAVTAAALSEAIRAARLVDLTSKGRRGAPAL
jgi:uncharacterized protein YegP (UPF0339 family)